MNQSRFRMPGEFPVGGYELREGDVLRIEDARSVLVKVVTGRTWITEERASQDVVRAAGQRFRLTRPGTAVIEAWETSTVQLTSPHAQDFARSVEVVRQPASPRLGARRGRHPWRALGTAAMVFLLRLWRALAPAPVRAQLPHF